MGGGVGSGTVTGPGTGEGTGPGSGIAGGVGSVGCSAFTFDWYPDEAPGNRGQPAANSSSAALPRLGMGSPCARSSASKS